FKDLWSQLKGSEWRRSIASAEHGIHTLTGEPQKLYKSIKECMQDIGEDDYDDFNTYWAAKSFLEIGGEKPDYISGQSKEDLESVVAMVESDPERAARFDKAARDMAGYNHALDLLEASEGAKSHAEHQRTISKRSEYYF